MKLSWNSPLSLLPLLRAMAWLVFQLVRTTPEVGAVMVFKAIGSMRSGHVATVTDVVSDRVIVIGMEADPRDANYKVLRENRRRLERLRDQDQRPFEIVELPMPRPVVPISRLAELRESTSL